MLRICIFMKFLNTVLIFVFKDCLIWVACVYFTCFWRIPDLLCSRLRDIDIGSHGWKLFKGLTGMNYFFFSLPSYVFSLFISFPRFSPLLSFLICFLSLPKSLRWLTPLELIQMEFAL